MLLCDRCRGTGTLKPSAFSDMPLVCYRCSGLGKLRWEDLKAGDHVCYLYDSPAEQLNTISRFLAAGIKNGERCLYLADTHSVEEVKNAVAAQGVNVKSEAARGALQITRAKQSYLKNGAFDPVRMLGFLSEALKETSKKGFAGLRGAGEMSWSLDSEEHRQALVEYELMADLFFLEEHPNFIGVCQYDRALFPASITQGARLSHRLVVQD